LVLGAQAQPAGEIDPVQAEMQPAESLCTGIGDGDDLRAIRT